MPDFSVLPGSQGGEPPKGLGEAPAGLGLDGSGKTETRWQHEENAYRVRAISLSANLSDCPDKAGQFPGDSYSCGLFAFALPD